MRLNLFRVILPWPCVSTIKHVHTHAHKHTIFIQGNSTKGVHYYHSSNIFCCFVFSLNLYLDVSICHVCINMNYGCSSKHSVPFLSICSNKFNRDKTAENDHLQHFTGDFPNMLCNIWYKLAAKRITFNSISYFSTIEILVKKSVINNHLYKINWIPLN